jgi:hypothetical protein
MAQTLSPVANQASAFSLAMGAGGTDLKDLPDQLILFIPHYNIFEVNFVALAP